MENKEIKKEIQILLDRYIDVENKMVLYVKRYEKKLIQINNRIRILQKQIINPPPKREKGE